MDFIVSMKERKKELKKNLAQQKDKITECFGEIRTCIDFYEKQSLKLVQDQFSSIIKELEELASDSKLRAGFLEEQSMEV